MNKQTCSITVIGVDMRCPLCGEAVTSGNRHECDKDGGVGSRRTYSLAEWQQFSELMSLCEWNPELNEPAVTGPRGNELVYYAGCKNKATVSVGFGKGKTNWHLCESCAALPKFKRYRTRKQLETGRS